jgi:hypothetical protein
VGDPKPLSNTGADGLYALDERTFSGILGRLAYARRIPGKNANNASTGNCGTIMIINAPNRRQYRLLNFSGITAASSSRLDQFLSRVFLSIYHIYVYPSVSLRINYIGVVLREPVVKSFQLFKINWHMRRNNKKILKKKSGGSQQRITS